MKPKTQAQAKRWNRASYVARLINVPAPYAWPEHYQEFLLSDGLSSKDAFTLFNFLSRNGFQEEDVISILSNVDPVEIASLCHSANIKAGKYRYFNLQSGSVVEVDRPVQKLVANIKNAKRALKAKEWQRKEKAERKKTSLRTNYTLKGGKLVKPTWRRPKIGPRRIALRDDESIDAFSVGDDDRLYHGNDEFPHM